jgi:hypothetical protein
VLVQAWCVVLGWCGAAADRRVRDHATKAAVRLSEHDPSIWPALVDMFADVDDDAVLERVLCAAYGAILRNPVAAALSELALTVRDRVLRKRPETPSHALIRGHAHAIGEWAAQRRVLPQGVSAEDFRPPHAQAIHIQVPSAAELEQYESSRDYPRIYTSVMSDVAGDFAIYTMPSVLGDYESLLGRDETRRWVLGTVIELGYSPEMHVHYDHEMLTTYGPGRDRPEWAERIGKKYQRIALGRLLGLLDDLAHAQGKPTSFPCQDLRDLDPSLLQRKAVDDEPVQGPHWWVPVAMDFVGTASVGNEAWVGGDDFPDPAALVAELIDPDRPNQRWRLLDGNFSWNDRGSGTDRERYRDIWMMIKGYLVPRRHIQACFEALGKADFMGRWMVEGFDGGGDIYMGEYPWAPHFPGIRERTEPWGKEAKQLARFDLRPIANELSCTGDSWQDSSVSITVPSAELVVATATRWDGISGFQTEDGRVFFRDPSVTVGGPSALLIDGDALTQIHSSLDVVVLWTVLAERRVIGSWRDDGFCGMKHISMVMWLDGQQVRVRKARGEHMLPDRTKRPV